VQFVFTRSQQNPLQTAAAELSPTFLSLQKGKKVATYNTV